MKRAKAQRCVSLRASPVVLVCLCNSIRPPASLIFSIERYVLSYSGSLKSSRCCTSHERECRTSRSLAQLVRGSGSLSLPSLARQTRGLFDCRELTSEWRLPPRRIDQQPLSHLPPADYSLITFF